MIPKIIHYCWFGGKEKPKCVLKMINSWKKYCPDYEIKEWNELNFDISINQYCKEAYQSGKWAFVSDVARLYALYTEGGIYLDTDVEVVKSLDSLLSNDVFLGFEGTQLVATSCIGAKKKHPFISLFLNSYSKRVFIQNNKLDTLPNVEVLTQLLIEQYGLKLNGCSQEFDSIKIYSKDYFSPYDYVNGRLKKTNNTYTIHWFSQSWIKRNYINRLLAQLFHRILGVKLK